MKKEIKIALVLDDYKLPDKEKYWKESLKRAPQIERDYEFVREEIGPGIAKGTVSVFRYYKLKEQ